jgi:DNA polymerase I-like protein with 3'-5' exonuclease and polymerase domains
MGIRLSDGQAIRIHNAWHTAFKAFKLWRLWVKLGLIQNGFGETATGFRRHFGDFNKLPSQQQAEAIREMMNCESQTLAAHIAYLALCELHRRGLPINGFFHDSISFDVTDEQANDPEFRQTVEYCMTQYPIQALKTVFGVDFDVPLTVKWSCDE